MLATKKLKVRYDVCHDQPAPVDFPAYACTDLRLMNGRRGLLTSRFPTDIHRPCQMKIDRKRLQEVVGVQAGELNNVVQSMQVSE